MYLLTIANAEVQTATYHGSYGLKTIATNKPVRTAPSGNSQTPYFFRRINTSIRAAAATAPASPGASSLMLWPSKARAISIARTMRTRPLGVRKNRLIPGLTATTPHVARRMPLQGRRDHQPIDALTLEQSNAGRGAKDERRCCERVRRHRRGRDHGHARHGVRRGTGAWIENVMAAVGAVDAVDVLSRGAPA